jgi:hypothetical protein
MPNQTATALALELAKSSPIGDSPAPDFAIQVALIPTLLVLGVAALIQFFSKRKR